MDSMDKGKIVPYLIRIHFRAKMKLTITRSKEEVRENKSARKCTKLVIRKIIWKRLFKKRI